MHEETNYHFRAIEVTKKAFSKGKSITPVFGFFDQDTDLAKQADAAFRDADQEVQKCLAEFGVTPTRSLSSFISSQSLMMMFLSCPP
jgi:hypothetical protein